MKKLILALSAALLLLSACGEKTKTYTFNGVQITYPASWKVDDFGSALYFQDPKNLSNSLDLEVIVNDAEEIEGATEEDLTDYLYSLVESVYEENITDSYNVSFKTDILATDTQALMTLSGTAYDEVFCGDMSAWLEDNIAFTAFFSAKDDKSLSEIKQIFKFDVL